MGSAHELASQAQLQDSNILLLNQLQRTEAGDLSSRLFAMPMASKFGLLSLSG